MDKDFKAIRQALNGAKLSEEARVRALWCLEQLPALYRGLAETYESRYVDEISRLVSVMVGRLAEKTSDRPVAVAVEGRLRAMHERLGIPALSLKPLAPAKTPRQAS
jgi:hypothetical protein